MSLHYLVKTRVSRCVDRSAVVVWMDRGITSEQNGTTKTIPLTYVVVVISSSNTVVVVVVVVVASAATTAAVKQQQQFKYLTNPRTKWLCSLLLSRPISDRPELTRQLNLWCSMQTYHHIVKSVSVASPTPCRAQDHHTGVRGTERLGTSIPGRRLQLGRR